MDASEEVRIDDNIDELFRQKMEKLKELGLYDDRTMHRMNQINDMTTPNTSSASTCLPYKPPNAKRFRSEELVEFKGEDSDEESGRSGFKPIENSSFKWSLPIGRQRGSNRDANRDWDKRMIPGLPIDREKEYHMNKEMERNRDRNDFDRKPNVEAIRDNRYRDRNDFEGKPNWDRDRDWQRGRDRDRDGQRGWDRDRDRDWQRDRDDIDTKPKVEPIVENDIMNDIFNDCKTDDDKAVVSEEIVRRIDATDDRTIANVREEVMDSINKRVQINKTTQNTTNVRNFFDNRRSNGTEKKKTETITDIEAFIRDCNKKAEKPKPLIFDDIDDFIAKANQRFDAISNMDPNSSQTKTKKSNRKPT